MGITGTVEDWQKVIWSDECISRIGPTRQRVLYPICVTVSQRSNVPPTSIPTKHGIQKQQWFIDLNHPDCCDSSAFKPQRKDVQLSFIHAGGAFELDR
jgi:hypothetical protein